MTVTVTDDFIVIDNADDTTGWNGQGGPTQNTVNQIEGAACIEMESQTGVNEATFARGAGSDYANAIIAFWFQTSQLIDTKAAGGAQIRISTGTDVLSNFGQWNVGGSDTLIGPYLAYHRWTVHTTRPFNASAGTVPTRTSANGIGMVLDLVTSQNRVEVFFDQVAIGHHIQIAGGTGGDPGVSSEVAVSDRSNGFGYFKNYGGPFFINCGVKVGTEADATTAIFRDSNEVWVFEDALVIGTSYFIEFLGGTGTNEASFGTEVGTGVAAVGVGGNAFVAGGPIPFRVIAVQSDTDVNFFGCTFTNPAAALTDVAMAVEVEDNSGASFTEETLTFNRDVGTTTFLYFPAGAGADDATYFGYDDKFHTLLVDTSAAGVGTYTVTWEYHDGTSWVALEDVTDGSTGFKTTGSQSVTFAVPDNWATQTVGGEGPHFFIRARRDGGTVTTDPVCTAGDILYGGRIRLEASTVKALSCTFTNFDTIVLRNSAILRKSTVTDGVGTAKVGAVDLGASDPAADTFRDMRIQNSAAGILLQKTVSGDVTYNFRNILFTGNTTDVRVDFPSGSVITINILEGGDTPTIDNVNGSTVNVVNTVTLTVTVKDEAGVAIESAQVGIFRDDTGVQLMNEATTGAGVATETFNFVSDLAVTVRVRKGTGGSTKYFSVSSPQTITSAGLALTATLVEDTINAS